MASPQSRNGTMMKVWNATAIPIGRSDGYLSARQALTRRGFFTGRVPVLRRLQSERWDVLSHGIYDEGMSDIPLRAPK